jgi:S-adenosylmethionine-diacylglycerol 3-amino-3-carboxypropyl transferase
MPTMSDSTVARLKRAVHRNRRLSREGLLERLFTLWFQGLVYTQIWEDPRVDAEALQLDDASRILTISSAGCNVLNYLAHEPERVLAVDLNTAHMALTRLKIGALQHLPDHDQFLQFFGEGEGRKNVEAYREHIRPHLDETTRQFWDERPWAGLRRSRIHAFERGVYEHGVLARFQGFARWVSQLVQGREPDELLEADTLEEQRDFFEECVAPFFDHPVVRRIARQPATLYSFGIPLSQYQSLSDAADASIVDLYRDRLERLVCGFPLSDNYFAWQAFGRQYDTEHRDAIPPYLRAEHYGQLRYHLDRVETRITSLGDALRDQPDSSFDSFVLLDAMDWMEPEAIAALWADLARVGEPGARIIFRTAGPHSVVEPALPAELRDRFTYERTRSEALHAQDRSAIYGMFHLYVLTG